VPAHASRYRDALQSWVIGANQTAYATLAPVVAAHADHPVARAQLCQAGSDASAMAAAIDPDGDLPLALCGSLAHVIGPYLDAPFIARKVAPQGDAARGALQLAIIALSASTRSIDT
jgi:glucosamine kinase